MSYDVFISYSRADGAFAEVLSQRLNDVGVRCWMDRSAMKGGDIWKREIVTALEASPIMVLVFSSRTMSSQNVFKELSIASKKGKKIIPVRIEDVQPSGEWSYDLDVCNWEDAFGEDPARIECVVARIRQAVEQESPTTRSAPAAPQGTPTASSFQTPRAATDLFRSRLKKFLEDDGVIDGKEQEFLEDLRDACGLTADQAADIERDVRAAYVSEWAPAQQPIVRSAPVAQAALPATAPTVPTTSRLIWPRYARGFCRVRLAGGEEMSELRWPEAGRRFIENVERKVVGKTESGWPAGFEPAGKPERELADEIHCWVYSYKANPQRWFEVSCSRRLATDLVTVEVGWYSDTDTAIKRLDKANGELFYLLVGERVFAMYLGHGKEGQQPSLYSPFIVDAATLDSDDFVEEMATLFVNLVAKVTELGCC